MGTFLRYMANLKTWVNVPHFGNDFYSVFMTTRSGIEYYFGVAEIIDFCDFVSPTPEEQASRADAVQSVMEVIKYIWPQCKVWFSIIAIPITLVAYVSLDWIIKTKIITVFCLLTSTCLGRSVWII